MRFLAQRLAARLAQSVTQYNTNLGQTKCCYIIDDTTLEIPRAGQRLKSWA